MSKYVNLPTGSSDSSIKNKKVTDSFDGETRLSSTTGLHVISSVLPALYQALTFAISSFVAILTFITTTSFLQLKYLII
jgi:hypothetical protein